MKNLSSLCPIKGPPGILEGYYPPDRASLGLSDAWQTDRSVLRRTAIEVHSNQRGKVIWGLFSGKAKNLVLLVGLVKFTLKCMLPWNRQEQPN